LRPDAIEEIAGQFPGLTLQGGGVADPTYRTWWFESRSGETTWRTEAVSEEELLPTPLEEKAKIESMISESRERLAYQQEQLDELQAMLKNIAVDERLKPDEIELASDRSQQAAGGGRRE
jgi:hypothetical protein